MYETGAGGSAPRHVQQFLEEGHLRWDSLGEYCALVPALELAAAQTSNVTAALLAKTLDRAIGTYLEPARYPSRRVNEIDNRGSSFYFAMYWAQELAKQTANPELAEVFKPLAEKLTAAEETIVSERNGVQGSPADVGGYYRPGDEKADVVMRPSATLNEALAAF